jgi:hypothetical protein
MTGFATKAKNAKKVNNVRDVTSETPDVSDNYQESVVKAPEDMTPEELIQRANEQLKTNRTEDQPSEEPKSQPKQAKQTQEAGESPDLVTALQQRSNAAVQQNLQIRKKLTALTIKEGKKEGQVNAQIKRLSAQWAEIDAENQGLVEQALKFRNGYEALNSMAQSNVVEELDDLFGGSDIDCRGEDTLQELEGLLKKTSSDGSTSFNIFQAATDGFSLPESLASS